MDDDNDPTTCEVVINHEERYSIWLQGREMPLGGKAVGKSGPKADCLADIEAHWPDMRPRSVRTAMEAEKD